MKRTGFILITGILTLSGALTGLKAQSSADTQVKSNEVYVTDNEVYYTSLKPDDNTSGNKGSTKSISTKDNCEINSPQNINEVSSKENATVESRSMKTRLKGAFQHIKVVYKQRIGHDLSGAVALSGLR